MTVGRLQEHLRHEDVRTTTNYTPIWQQDFLQQLRVLDAVEETLKASRPSPEGN